jgi:hypothetical protein
MGMAVEFIIAGTCIFACDCSGAPWVVIIWAKPGGGTAPKVDGAP